MNRHTKTLSTLYIIWGSFQLLMGLIILIVFLSGSFIASQATYDTDAPPTWVFGMMSSMGVVLFIFVAAFGILNILSGTWISKRTNRTGTMVIAALNCLSIPLGLALGIYTFITLGDDQVKQNINWRPLRNSR